LLLVWSRICNWFPISFLQLPPWDDLLIHYPHTDNFSTCLSYDISGKGAPSKMHTSPIWFWHTCAPSSGRPFSLYLGVSLGISSLALSNFDTNNLNPCPYPCGCFLTTHSTPHLPLVCRHIFILLVLWSLLPVSLPLQIWF
jgi:hypothetical protein